jgi:hypothetical protein
MVTPRPVQLLRKWSRAIEEEAEGNSIGRYKKFKKRCKNATQTMQRKKAAGHISGAQAPTSGIIVSLLTRNYKSRFVLMN